MGLCSGCCTSAHLPGDSLGGRSDLPPPPREAGRSSGPGVGRLGERRRGDPRGFALPEPPKPLPACHPVSPERSLWLRWFSTQSGVGEGGGSPSDGPLGLLKTRAHRLWAVTGRPPALPPSRAAPVKSSLSATPGKPEGSGVLAGQPGHLRLIFPPFWAAGASGGGWGGCCWPTSGDGLLPTRGAVPS